MNVFVTGASGFIGSQLVDTLLKKRTDLHVVGIDQRSGHGNDPRHLFLQGNIADPKEVPQQLKTCDVLIHCAALVHKKSHDLSRDHYFAVNTAGTINVLNALDPGRVKQVIFLSTVSVYGNSAENGVPDEQWPPSPCDYYGESKWAAEEALREYTGKTGVPHTIFRLTPVYGREFLLNIAKRILLPRGAAFYRIGSGKAAISLCSVGNVLDALAWSLGNEKTLNQAYILRDKRNYSLNEIIGIFKTLEGYRNKRTLNIPEFLPLAVFSALKCLWPDRGNLLLYNLKKITHDQVYSDQKALHSGIPRPWDLESTLR